MSITHDEALGRGPIRSFEDDPEKIGLKEFLAQAPAAIAFLRGPEHRYSYVNDLYIHAAGRTGAGELIARSADDVQEVRSKFWEMSTGLAKPIEEESSRWHCDSVRLGGWKTAILISFISLPRIPKVK